MEKTFAASVPGPIVRDESHNITAQVDDLLRRTREIGTWGNGRSNDIFGSGNNLVAFSGGIDSSLVAQLVKMVNDGHRDEDGRQRHAAVAVLGVGPALGAAQHKLAKEVAEHIGIELVEIATAESTSEGYIANEGMACYHCKTHLYQALNAVGRHAETMGRPDPDGEGGRPATVLYNGTNLDDTRDATRVGLLAASDFRVASPLDRTAKEGVRAAARHLGLPNWAHASSPCLRSRLAFGVQATSEHLERVERSEEFVRTVLKLGVERSMRVRMLAGGRAAVELDEVAFEDGAAVDVLERAELSKKLNQFGFSGEVIVRKFKTGAVAAVAKQKENEKVAA